MKQYRWNEAKSEDEVDWTEEDMERKEEEWHGWVIGGRWRRVEGAGEGGWTARTGQDKPQDPSLTGLIR